MKEVPWLYFFILFAVTYSFTSCATKPVTVKSDQPIVKKGNQGKLASKKIKQVPNDITKPKSGVSQKLQRRAQIENESSESSVNVETDLQQKETESLIQVKGNDIKGSKDLVSSDKEAVVFSGLKTGNEKIAEDVGIGNKKMDVSNETTNQEDGAGLESFFSVDSSKPTREENGGIESKNEEAIADQENETGGASGKLKANINKGGDASLHDNEKPLADSSDSILNPVETGVNAQLVEESNGVVTSSGMSKAVSFTDQVQSALGDDLIKNNVAVGYLESTNSLGDKDEVGTQVQSVGFGKKNQRIPNVKPFTDSAREDKISRQKPRTFGRVRTFLDRGEFSGIEEGVLDERGFKRTKDFLETDRSTSGQDFPVLDQKTDTQYDKTLKWIKNRGRID